MNRSSSTLVTVILLSSLSTAALAQQTLTGTWACRTAVGQSQLEFQSSRVLAFDGQQMAYRILGNAIQVIEDGLPANYTFRLTGDRLAITTPDGSPIDCQRAAAPEMPQAEGPTTGTGGSFNHLLAGKLCAWSGASSSTGSYSSTQIAWFDGRGSFSTGSESSFSTTHRDAGGNPTGTGGGYGQGDGPGGRYEVTAVQVGAPVRIRWSGGEDDVAYVHHVAGGKITEVKYGKQLFGMGLCE